MKANIEKVLKEIGDSRGSLEELVVLLGQPNDYEDKTLEELREILRNSIEEGEKEKFVQMCMGVGAIEYNEQKISEY